MLSDKLMTLVIFILLQKLSSIKAISTEDCGVNKGCLRLPKDCELQSCSYLGTYRRQGDIVIFEMFGKDADWVAIGFNDVQAMKGTYAVFCYKNNSDVSIRSGKITAYKLPDLFEEPNLKLMNKSSDNTSIMCRFEHPYKTDNSSNLRSLDTNIYLIYAKGPKKTNQISYHGSENVDRGFSSELINISHVVTSEKDMENKISTEDCGVNKGCLRLPKDCELQSCSYLGTYRRQGDIVMFEMFGKDADWVAIGFNDVQTMKGTYAVFCYKNNSDVFIRSGKITGYQLPDLFEQPNLKLMNKSSDNTSIMCRFEHPYKTDNSSNLRSLDTNIYLIYAKGPKKTNEISYHGNKNVDRGFSSELINISHVATSEKDMENKISTEDCGVNKGCLRIPKDCELQSCSYLGTYRRQGDIVMFEMFGKDADWVAIGFNDGQAMKGTHAVFCYKNNSDVSIRSGKITAYKLPDLFEEPNLKLINKSSDNTSIMCRFEHPYKTDNSSNLRSLDTNIYLIYAKGPKKTNEISYHGNKNVDRGFSSELINISHVATSEKDMENKISTEDCGVNKGCLRIPKDCELQSCSYLGTYRRQGDIVMFEMSGKDADWVAIGFNDGQAMKGTHAVFCYKNNSDVSIRSGKITAKKLPDLLEEPNLKLINKSSDNTSIMCRFEHPYKTDNSSNLRSLDTNIYLIYAKGPKKTNQISYHGSESVNRGFSSELINISNVVTSEKDMENKENTTDDTCGKTIGCLRYPSGCEFSKCSYLATYKAVKDRVTFELFATNAEWVAIGFNDDQRMIGTDAVFCYKSTDKVILEWGILAKKSLPQLTQVKELEHISSSIEGGSIRCSFSRPLNSSTLVNLEDRFLYLIYAKGKTSPGVPGYHGNGLSNRGFSAERVNIESTTESSLKSPSNLKKRVHGSLMVAIWLFVASTGIFFARYTRDSWSDAELFGKKVWFQFHRFLMVSVVLGTISSIVVIFVDLEGFTQGENKFKTHAILGLVVLGLATLQPIGALLRPHPGTSKRPIFNFFHRLFGVSAFVISLAAIVFGLDIFDKENAFVVVLGYVGFLAAVIIMMEIVKIFYEKKKQKSTIDVLPGGLAIEKPIANTTHPFLTLSKIFLVILFMVSLAVAAVVIYFINKNDED